MQKYCLVYLIEKLNEGDEFTAINYWPLHITLVSNFILDIEKVNLINKLSDLVSAITPVQVWAGNDEYFGKDKKIQVTVLDMTKELLSLHKQVIALLENVGAVFDEPQYNNDGYRAHATVQKTLRLNKGDTITIDKITLVDMLPGQDITKRKILKTLKFKSV